MLEDDKLIESLKESKKVSEEVEERERESKITEDRIK